MTSFEIEQTDGAGVVRPQGRLNMASAPQFTKAVADLVAGGCVRIVVDLSATDFIDSSGLGALVASLKAARQAGGDLRLAGTTPQVDTILALTNLNRVLQPSATVAAALALL